MQKRNFKYFVLYLLVFTFTSTTILYLKKPIIEKEAQNVPVFETVQSTYLEEKCNKTMTFGLDSSAGFGSIFNNLLNAGTFAANFNRTMIIKNNIWNYGFIILYDRGMVRLFSIPVRL